MGHRESESNRVRCRQECRVPRCPPPLSQDRRSSKWLKGGCGLKGHTLFLRTNQTRQCTRNAQIVPRFHPGYPSTHDDGVPDRSSGFGRAVVLPELELEVVTETVTEVSVQPGSFAKTGRQSPTEPEVLHSWRWG
eukprot:2353848-Rhodomonas_salina.1